MKLIDFHSHLFSRTFFEALAHLSERPGTVEEKLASLAERTGIEIPPADLEQHVQHWLDEMDRSGVEHLVSFASAPEEIPTLAEAARLAGGRITPVAVVDPTAAGAAERVHDLLEAGPFAGVLLFPALHHFDIGGAGARGVLQALDHHKAIAFVHCGLLAIPLRDHLGIPRRYDLRRANPLALIPAADAHPSVRFIIPHFGAGYLRETLMAGAQCENIYVDTSSSHGWLRTEPSGITLTDAFALILDVFTSERVLFGTDSSTFPRGWRADLLETQLAIFDQLSLPPPDRDRILAENARRLLNS